MPAVTVSISVSNSRLDGVADHKKLSPAMALLRFPGGIKTIYVSGCAGGGDGAGQANIKVPYNVTPDQAISVTVGLAGTAGARSSSGCTGGHGGNIIVGSLVALTGGANGSGGANETAGAGKAATGGNSGAGAPGGTSGQDVIAGTPGGSGGAGASGPFGGGAARSSNAEATAADGRSAYGY